MSRRADTARLAHSVFLVASQTALLAREQAGAVLRDLQHSVDPAAAANVLKSALRVRTARGGSESHPPPGAAPHSEPQPPPHVQHAEPPPASGAPAAAAAGAESFSDSGAHAFAQRAEPPPSEPPLADTIRSHAFSEPKPVLSSVRVEEAAHEAPAGPSSSGSGSDSAAVEGRQGEERQGEEPSSPVAAAAHGAEAPPHAAQASSAAAAAEAEAGEARAHAHGQGPHAHAHHAHHHHPSHTGHGAAHKAPFKKRIPKERSVPSTPISRVWHFGGLGLSLAAGTLTELAKRTLGPKEAPSASGYDKGKVYAAVLSEANAERLAEALCRMRGAALKLGQMLSIQDEHTIPPQVQAVLERVRQGADVMPQRQLHQVMASQFGEGWREQLAEFGEQPIAAASIGQVHRGVLREPAALPAWDTGVPGEVAMKIQYPGVAESIDSDLDNLKRLVTYTSILPEGLFVDHAVREMRAELKEECDYRREAEHQRRFAALVADDPRFKVPAVIESLSSERVITTEMVKGFTIAEVANMSQETRNAVAMRMLELTLRELFEFHFMQTDPNWGNFLYDPSTDLIKLIDFGACREYPPEFVDDYIEIVHAAAERDRQRLVDASIRLHFLTGDESKAMLDAHVESGFIVGEPFAAPGAYDFKNSGMTQRVQQLGQVMLKHRLTPPPKEAYSLHRKLSGAFLLCIKLGAVIPCRDAFLRAYEGNRAAAAARRAAATSNSTAEARLSTA